MAAEEHDEHEDYESLTGGFDDEEEEQDDYFGEDEDEDEYEDEDEDEEFEDEDESEDDAEEDEESEDEGEDGEEEGDEEDEESEEEETAELPVWADKIKAHFPDREFNTLADYDAANAEYMESLESTIEASRETEQQLVNIFNQHEELATMFAYLNKGYSPRAALVAAGFSPEDFVIEDGDEDAEQLVEAKLKRRNSVAERQKQQQKIETNSKKSQEAILRFQTKRGIKDSAWNEFQSKLENVFNRFIDADIDEDTLEMFWKAMNYDKDKRTAEDLGRIKGRNEKIAISKKKKQGDGVAKLKSSQAIKTSKKIIYDDPFGEILDRVHQMGD